MNDFLDKFKFLPKEIKEAVDSEEKIKLLEEIEKKYNLKLAKLIVRVMIKDVAWSDLEKFLVTEFKLEPEKASELKKELEEKIFNEVLSYLSEEKVKDLREEKKRVEEELVETMQPSVVKPTEIEEIIKKIKEKANLSFEDEILEKRFENTIISYLKEVRDEVQIEEILTRSKKIGGMELSVEKGAEILKILKEIRRNIPQAMRLIETKKPEVEKKPIFDEEVKKKFEGGTIRPVLKELGKPTEKKFLISNFQFPKIKKEEKLEKGEIPVQIKRPISEEMIVEDISPKPKVKVLGPIEELKEISLIDLKRWGREETIRIIFDKINLIGEESLFKKAEAISSWQKSPLFKLYLEIGQEAMEKKKSLLEVIEEREREGLPTLEPSDWGAISELNKKLRF